MHFKHLTDLYDVKVDDKLIRLIRGQEHIVTVKRVTKTLIIIDDHVRFNKRTSNVSPQSTVRFCHTDRIMIPEEGQMQRILDKSLRISLLGELQSFINTSHNIPTECLVNVRDTILKSIK